MTLEEADGLTPEQLMQVRDRPLVESYEVHDVGHEVLVRRLEAHGFHVEDHGDDARHADEVFYGDGPDLAVYDDDPDDGGELLGYVEIKCKEDAAWFGRCNLRHFREYVNFASEVSVPVFVWFAYVDADDGVVYRDAFHEVEDTDQIDGDVVDVSESDVVFYEDDVRTIDDEGLCAVDGSDVVGIRDDETLVDFIPDVWGNDVIEVNSEDFRSFPYVAARLDE